MLGRAKKRRIRIERSIMNRGKYPRQVMVDDPPRTYGKVPNFRVAGLSPWEAYGDTRRLECRKRIFFLDRLKVWLTRGKNCRLINCAGYCSPSQ